MAARLEKWDGRARGDGAEPAVLDFLRRDLLEELLKPHLKGGAAAYQWSRPFVFLENVLRERPSRWLPPGYTTYDHLLAASLGRAVTRAAAQAGHRIPLLMLHPFGRSGFLRRHLSIADLPQDGTGYSVKQTGRTFGPAMRFVADLSDLDKSLMNITAGQSGHYLSPHYRDQFPAWYGGHGLASAFSAAREAAGRKHHLTLLP
jgi:penicillin amidase